MAPQKCRTCHEINRDVSTVSLPLQTNLCTLQPANPIELYFLLAPPKMHATKTSITTIATIVAIDIATDPYGTTCVLQDTSIESYSVVTR